MTLQIRAAVPADYEGVTAVLAEVDQLHLEALPDRFHPIAEGARSRETIQRIIDDENAALLVAMVDGQIVGVAYIEHTHEDATDVSQARTYAYMHILVVSQTHRSTGAGHALMDAASTWARDHGLASMELNVFEFNQRAIARYEQWGFTTLSRVMHKTLDLDMASHTSVFRQPRMNDDTDQRCECLGTSCEDIL